MITENYIKMCEKAKKIQCERILGRYDFGDLYYLESEHKHGGKFRFIGSYDGYDNDKELIGKSVWLPTLEQLFDMMNPDYDDDWKVIICFRNWVHKQIGTTKKRITFMNYTVKELLLCWIYHEKWNKTWNGENWVKEERSK